MCWLNLLIFNSIPGLTPIFYVDVEHNAEMVSFVCQGYPEFPPVSPYGDLAEIKLDNWMTIEVKNLKKIANPQEFSVE
jgi:hypothetical protein